MTFLENVDKAKLQKILLITISALMLVALALLLAIVIMSIEPTGLQGTNMEFKDYTLTDKDVATGSLVLADDDHAYNYTFEDADLYSCGKYRNDNLEKDEEGKELNKYYMNDQSKMKLTASAMAAAHDMLVAAEAAVAKDDLLISSAYGYNNADTQEYNTALLIYLANYDDVALDSAYADWFDQHAAEYGFIESFENGYRYVGVAHAKYMTDEELTLAEYIEYLKENTSNENGLNVKVADEDYYIYYEAAEAEESIKVPADAEYVISGTNEGGVVVTVKLDK